MAREKQRRPARGGTRRIGGLIDRAAKSAFARRGFRESSVLTDWRAIVGPIYAARCMPESLRRGTLTLRADGATALELRHIEPQLRERCAAFFGYDAVKRVAYRNGPAPPAAPPPAAPPPVAPPPAEAAAALAGVPDAALREALVRLGRRVAGANRVAGAGRQGRPLL